MDIEERLKAIRTGAWGEGAKIALKVLDEMSRLYGGSRYIEIEQAHMDATACRVIGEAGIQFAEKMAAAGARVCVPTTMNATSSDRNQAGFFLTPSSVLADDGRLQRAYIQMGCIPICTCAPYDYGNPPHFGQHIAWAESNAVNYANSVIGARTARYPDLVDLCCAIVGAVPEIGLHISANRVGQILFQLDETVQNDITDEADFAALGYLIGGKTGGKIPVINGLKQPPGKDGLKAFSAASAAAGSVALFHVVGITPEAPSLHAAFQGKDPENVILVTRKDLERIKKELSTAEKEKVDLVVLGCPHASFREIWEYADILGGRKLADGCQLWVQTSRQALTVVQRSGLKEQMENCGVRFLEDTCLNNCPMDAWKLRHVVTNSGKMAHYCGGKTGAKISFRRTKECIDIAVRGSLKTGADH